MRKRVILISALFFLLLPALQPAVIDISFVYAKDQEEVTALHGEIRRQLDLFLAALVNGDTITATRQIEYFTGLIERREISDTTLLSDAFYYCGFYHLSLSKDYLRAAEMLESSFLLREMSGVYDRTYRQSQLNLGIAYSQAGEHNMAEEIYKKLLARIKEIDGAESNYIVSVYNSFSSAKVSNRDYTGAIEMASEGLRIADIAGTEDFRMILNMLITQGIAHSRLNDYSLALLYYEQAFKYARENQLTEDGIFLNLLNSLAVVNKTLGNDNQAEYYFEYGSGMPPAINIDAYLLLTNNRAVFLAERGSIEAAVALSHYGIELAAEIYRKERRDYVEYLNRHTRLLSEHASMHSEAMRVFDEELLPWTDNNLDDFPMVRDIFYSYSQVLMRAGRYSDALEAIQRSAFPSSGLSPPRYDNPATDEIIPDRIGLQILSDKADILRNIYRQDGDTTVLGYAVETNAFLISLVETMRIDISEEESRMLLGDNYRRIYNSMVADLALLYALTGRERWFEMAFEYAERSKSAGLLVSMRELRASRFMVPDSLSNRERDIDRRLGSIREQIAMMHQSGRVDQTEMGKLREREFYLALERSDLIARFEREFPDYYNARYNTKVAAIDDLLRVTGRRGNYLNYLITDTMLYIFVINRQEKALVAVPYGGDIESAMQRFRELLTDPFSGNNMRSAHQEYISAGFELYNYLIEPVKQHLISNRLIISPDNILTYLPFEAFITRLSVYDDLNYRLLPYMVNEYDISYTYSATMFIERQRGGRSFRNRVLAIAPSYNDSLLIKEILNPRSSQEDATLADLPFARREAEYIVGKWGGSLYLCGDALESVYKRRAPHYRVLHLAMHTVINNSAPAFSRLVFSDRFDGEEDGLLNTYEIYTVPLSARMVVLPSCNTGEGKLRTGEGVISLARGFINAGAESVVMSLWEVDDMHSTEVVLSFYDNLRKGMGKSLALQRAKREFLEESYQLQAHPYFWATLVIYGDDAPLFLNRANRVIFPLSALLLISAAILIVRNRSKRQEKS